MMGHLLVVLNRSGSERTLTNGLSFGFADRGGMEDILTGDRFTATGDSVSLVIPAMESRVLLLTSDS